MPANTTITLGEQLNYTSRTKHEFVNKFLKYNLPHVINNIPDLVIDMIVTHSLRGFSSYAKHYTLQKYNVTCTILNCYICQLNKIKYERVQHSSCMYNSTFQCVYLHAFFAFVIQNKGIDVYRMLFLICVGPTIATSFGLSRILQSHSNFFISFFFSCIIYYFVDYLLIIIEYCSSILIFLCIMFV